MFNVRKRESDEKHIPCPPWVSGFRTPRGRDGSQAFPHSLFLTKCRVESYSDPSALCLVLCLTVGFLCLGRLWIPGLGWLLGRLAVDNGGTAVLHSQVSTDQTRPDHCWSWGMRLLSLYFYSISVDRHCRSRGTTSFIWDTGLGKIWLSTSNKEGKQFQKQWL